MSSRPKPHPLTCVATTTKGVEKEGILILKYKTFYRFMVTSLDKGSISPPSYGHDPGMAHCSPPLSLRGEHQRAGQSIAATLNGGKSRWVGGA